MEGKCVQFDVIYQAEVCKLDQAQGTGKLYVGLASGEWKLRYNNHKASFGDPTRRNDSELAGYIWQLQDNNIEFKVHWKKVQNAKPYTKEAKRCNLCTFEKVEIMKLLKEFPNRVLNKREEIMGSCKHRRKHLLGMVARKKEPDINGGLAEENRHSVSSLLVQSTQIHEVSSSLQVKDTSDIIRNINDNTINGNLQEQMHESTTISVERGFGRLRSGKSWRKQSHGNLDPG